MYYTTVHDSTMSHTLVHTLVWNMDGDTIENMLHMFMYDSNSNIYTVTSAMPFYLLWFPPKDNIQHFGEYHGTTKVQWVFNMILPVLYHTSIVY